MSRDLGAAIASLAAPLLLGLPPAWAQPELKFEVASVKKASSPSGFSRGSGSPGYFRASNTPLSSLIMRAYDLPRWQIIGPDWLRAERFDIYAKLPADATEDRTRIMLRNLLVERFGLVTHRETQERDIYELAIARGRSKLIESKLPSGNPPGQPLRSTDLKKDANGLLVAGMEVSGMITSRSPEAVRWTFRDQPLSELVNMLQNQFGRTVVDNTGLNGRYHWDLTIEPADSNDGSASVFDALARLGLKLVPAKAPIEMLVVDCVNKEPTEN